MIVALKNLRDKIDTVDQSILKLLDQRLSLAKKIGDIKSKYGKAIYAPDRERKILDARRKDAIALGVSPNLIEDLLRRIMRESYLHEKIGCFKNMCPQQNCRSVVIISYSKNEIGVLFKKFFTLSGYQVHILEEDWSRLKILISSAGIVIINVPIHLTLSVIHNLPSLSKNCILLDLTFLRSESIKAMLTVHSGPVLGLHPMFSPSDIDDCLVKQLILYCDGRYPKEYQWLLEQIQFWGARLHRIDIDALQHDQNISYLHVLRYFMTFLYGFSLAEEKIDLKEILTVSSTIDWIELILVGRLFPQDPELFFEMIISSKQYLNLIKRYYLRLGDALRLIEESDKPAFISCFERIRQWCGSDTEMLLSESRRFLRKVNDFRQDHRS